MDRTFVASTVVFIALAVVGVAFVIFADSLSASEPMVFQAVGAALLASGLTAFIIEGFRWDRTHHGV